MTGEEFIEVLDNLSYSYKIIKDKIVVTSKSKEGIDLVGTMINGDHGLQVVTIDKIPSGVIFQGKGDINLSSLEFLPDDVEFRNMGNVDLSSMDIPINLIDSFNNSGDITFKNLHWSGNWEGNLEGIDNKRLLRFMISNGVFI
jgi:hypothetical protein